ncbi:MAG: tetratricopeptide repeat protein [Bacteroidales bacterium]|nr:tetratricopeptide repeat protein [Bacteroidales bacterium]
MRYLLYIGIFWFATGFSLAAPADSLFMQANHDYENQLFNNAIDKYEQILDMGISSAELYYNLGNSYFKLDDYPSAILYYEKALKIDPHDPDIEYNLNLARTRIVDKIEPLPELFLRTWWKSLVNLFLPDQYSLIVILTLYLFFVLLGIYLLSRSVRIRKAAFYLALTLLFVSLLSFWLALNKYRLMTQEPEAIVFTPTITVKSSPNDNSVDLFVIHEGLKVMVTDRIGDWIEIRIASGSVGWIPADAVKNI